MTPYVQTDASRKEHGRETFIKYSFTRKYPRDSNVKMKNYMELLMFATARRRNAHPAFPCSTPELTFTGNAIDVAELESTAAVALVGAVHIGTLLAAGVALTLIQI